jgi:hypothetical protein
VRSSFRAADLQKYTETEQGVPARDVVAKLKAMTSKEPRRAKKK